MVVNMSIFIEFLRTKNKKKTKLANLALNQRLHISSVTLYELLMGTTDEQKLKDVNLLVDGITVLSFDETIAKKSGEIYQELRKENKLIEFRDLFIAATCVVNNLPLLTSNQKHFSRITSLVLL
jgi:tRNA(fMet)-specific endonuclease VapC